MSVIMAKLIFNSATKLPVILQNEIAECGHACVAMISNFLGHDIDLFHIRKMHSPSVRGMTLVDIHNLFEQLGFLTRALRVSLEEMHLIKCPAILHWNMNHFVVLKEVKKNHVVIHDPAVGLIKCTRDEVSKSFTGIVLEIEKSNDFKVIKNKSRLTLYDLVKTIRGVNKCLSVLILLSLSIEVLSLFNPLFMQFVTDNVIAASDINNLYLIAAVFVVLIFIQAIAEYIRGHMVIYITNSLTEQFAANVVKHLLKLPLAFFEKRHKGDIQSKFYSIDHIQKKMSTEFINTVLNGLMIIINLSVMFIYSQLLTSIVVVALFFYGMIRNASYQFLKKETESSLHLHAETASVFLETLQGIAPIKSFLKEKMRFNRWRNGYIHSLNADIKISRMNVIYSLCNQLLFHVEHIIVVCAGASLVLSNQFSMGMLIAFLSYRMLLVGKASSFIEQLFDYKLISIQLERLSDILFYPPETMTSGFGKGERVKGALTWKNVCFHYHSEEKATLKNINLQVNAGEKIAIIGPSGCGKSTFLKVSMGLLPASSGDLLIDDMAIREFGLKNFRELTAAVMQEDTLLSGSILDNIAFFDEEIDLEYVHQVAKLAFIHHVICELPMGYETLVGDMGSTLSGGEKQRILLARALYKKPKILFLDEASSHLDALSEQQINASLKSLAITQIIIAHRKETIAMADRVINLEDLNQH